uniref:ANK_REP_REGION domain-containing protein n=1 Tax=Setaria digitata TaxID=48799 RepID=A0A915PIL6_9BILA
MGNRESSTKEDDGKPKGSDQPRLYRYVDIHGGGELLPAMWQAKNSGDYSQIDELIDSKIKNFMYNSGKGKMVAVSELVKIRNKERNAMLSALKRKKGKGKSGPNILDDFNQEGENQGDLKKVINSAALKLLEGGGRRGDADSKYREVVWKLDERGNMGENLVGLCLLQGTEIHSHLARHLIKIYPKLVNDIFISENYYGLSPLHQAIVNEDPEMVSFLLRHGANINQRCYGASFCPDDQKSSRTDSLEHEYVELSLKTCYTGRMYFGEYPLSFAACINQTDCFRLLVAKKADLNQKDTNGNTVLHLAVIHEHPEMIKLSYDMGAKLQIVNKQNLTPLTLAAHLGKKEIFEQILKLEADVVWMYGNASSYAYPLARIDTISQETGEMNEDSALSLTVYGETTKHLELLDGLLEELLEAKWEAFGRR